MHPLKAEHGVYARAARQRSFSEGSSACVPTAVDSAKQTVGCLHGVSNQAGRVCDLTVLRESCSVYSLKAELGA